MKPLSTTRKLCTVHRAPPTFALLLTGSLLGALYHTAFDHPFSLPHLAGLLLRFREDPRPTSTHLPRSIESA